MNFRHTTIGALLVSALALSAAQAQTTMPASRAGVKADAAMNAASQPKGEMSVPNQDRGAMVKPGTSTTTRAEVKAEAKAARAAGSVPMGEQSTPNQGKAPPKRMSSDTTRAEVKAEAAAAARSGETPRGQATQKDQDKGVTKP